MNGICKTRLGTLYLAIAVAVAGFAGCGMPKASDLKPSKLFSLDNSWPWGEDEPAEGTPVRVVGAWTDTVLTQPGQPPQRGFGGRLMFYGSDNEEPILVDGQLVVYAFDETGRVPTDNKPTRRYVFPADQIARHMSKSELGAAYSFWLPCDEAGGPRTEVSLICRFEPKGGSVVTGEQTRHLLPGSMEAGVGVSDTRVSKLPEGVPSRPAQPTLESLQTSHRFDSGAQQASYQSPVNPQVALAANPAEAASGEPDRQMTVTSITLPRNFQLGSGAPTGRTGVAPHSSTPTPTQPQQPTLPIQQQSAPLLQQPAAAHPQALPANAGLGEALARPATNLWHPPAAQPPAMSGFGTYSGARSQLITPQFMTTSFGQPASSPTAPSNGMPAGQMNIGPQQQMPAQAGVTTNVNYSSPGAYPQRPGG